MQNGLIACRYTSLYYYVNNWSHKSNVSFAATPSLVHVLTYKVYSDLTIDMYFLHRQSRLPEDLTKFEKSFPAICFGKKLLICLLTCLSSVQKITDMLDNMPELCTIKLIKRKDIILHPFTPEVKLHFTFLVTKNWNMSKARRRWCTNMQKYMFTQILKVFYNI